MKNYLAIMLLVPSLLVTACETKDTQSDWDDTASASDEGADSDDDASGADHVVTSVDGNNNFDPVDLTIAVGDTVRFEMSNTHNAIEVSQQTYDDRGVDALAGGFQVTFGETKEVTFTEAGTHYYVCTPHVTMGMIGTITVE